MRSLAVLSHLETQATADGQPETSTVQSIFSASPECDDGYVLKRRERRKQIEVLEDESDAPEPNVGKPVLSECADHVGSSRVSPSDMIFEPSTHPRDGPAAEDEKA